MGGVCVKRPLNPNELHFAASSLGLTVPQVQKLYDDFMRASRNGCMSKAEFRRFYRAVAPWGKFMPPRRVKRLTDRVFAGFDWDRNGFLTFNEFVSAMVMLNGRGSVKDKLGFLFRCTSPTGVLPPTISMGVIQQMCQGFDSVYKVNSYNAIQNTLATKFASMTEIPTEEVLNIFESDTGYAPVMQRSFDFSSSENETD